MITKRKNSLERTKRLITIALFAAMSYISTLIFHISVSFLTFDPKDAVTTVGAMLLGPIAGIIISAVVSLIEFITISDTGIYGLIMNFVSSAVFSVLASVIYKYKRKMSGAIIALVCSVIATVATMLLMNLIITPYFMGVSISDVVALIPTLLLPFNLLKTLLNASLVLFLYKPVTTAMRAARLVEKKPFIPENIKRQKYITIAVAIISALFIAACIIIFLTLLGGKI